MKIRFAGTIEIEDSDMSDFMRLITLCNFGAGGSVAAPVAGFTTDDDTPTNSQLVTFANTSTGEITSYDWDFGDGSEHSTDESPTHTFATPGGPYTVTLTVTGPGGSDSATDSVTVTLDPLTVTGLFAWYDHASLSTLYQDSAKTTPVASVNDPVGAWADKSATGADLLQATADARASYQTDGVQFDSTGTNDFLRSAAITEKAQPNMLFIVASTDGPGSTQTVLDGISSGKRHLIRYDGSSGTIFTANAGANLTTPAGQVFTSPIILAVVFNGASSAVYRNSLLVASGNAGTQGLTGLTVGDNYAGSSLYGGKVKEMLAVNGDVTDATRQKIETYLAARHNIALESP